MREETQNMSDEIIQITAHFSSFCDTLQQLCAHYKQKTNQLEDIIRDNQAKSTSYQNLAKENAEMRERFQPLFICCPSTSILAHFLMNLDCTFQFLWLEGESEKLLTPFNCARCGKSYCFKCKSVSHPSKSCEENSRSFHYPLNNQIKMGMKLKMCHNCNYMVSIKSLAGL
jgi:hypothetical protein